MDWPGRRAGRNLIAADCFSTSFVFCCLLRYFDDDYNDYHDLSLKGGGMGAQNWTVAEAKAKFSEIIDRAMSEGPQTITRKGRTAAVVVGAEEWQRKTMRAGNLAEFFAGSPLRGSNLRVRRLKARPRKIRL